MKINSIYLVLLIVFLFGITSELRAQEENNTSFSLKEAQEYAIKNNYTVKNSALDISFAKAQVNEIRAIGLPQINGDFSYQNYLDIPTMMAPASMFDPTAPEDLFIPLQFGTEHNATATFTASQLIFDGTYIVGLQAAKLYYLMSERMHKKSEIEIKDMVTRTYHLILVAEENKKVLFKSKEEFQRMLKKIREINKSGFIEDLEVEQLELILSNMENSVTKVDGQILNTYKLLKFQMGLDIDGQLELKDSLEGILSEIDIEVLVSAELNADDHIDMMLVNTRESLMQLNLKKEKYARLPSLGAFMTHSQNAFSNEFEFNDWYPTTLWGVQLKLPLFDGFGRESRIKQARFELKKTQNSRSLLAQSLKLQISTARTGFSTAYTQHLTGKKNMELARKIHRKTIMKYKEGMASGMDVAQASNQFLTAQGNYFNSIFELLIAKTKLDRALNNY